LPRFFERLAEAPVAARRDESAAAG
jgi:hypothetical protein